MIVNGTQLADLYNVDRRTVTNWINSDPACPSWKDGKERKFDTAAVAAWKEQQAVNRAVAAVSRQDPENIDEAKRRKLTAEALLAEIDVQERQGQLLPVDIVETVLGETCDRLRAVAINVPSNYGVRLEHLGVSSKDAQEALEAIADDMIQALRSVGDDIEADGDTDD